MKSLKEQLQQDLKGIPYLDIVNERIDNFIDYLKEHILRMETEKIDGINKNKIQRAQISILYGVLLQIEGIKLESDT